MTLYLGLPRRAIGRPARYYAPRTQERNVETGLLVRDAQIALRLATHFRALTRLGALLPLPLPPLSPAASDA